MFMFDIYIKLLFTLIPFVALWAGES